MAEEKVALFIIFGASGDLANRKLYPALYNLYRMGYLKTRFAVIGTARRKWSDDFYHDKVTSSISDLEGDDETKKKFASHFYYQSHDVTDSEHYKILNDVCKKLDEQYNLAGNRIYYMSVSPKFFGTIAQHLKSEQLITDNGFNRLVIEKPFGHDYDSAKQLNSDLDKTFPEKDIFRLDHYLGKKIVQSIPIFRFANPIIESVWNKENISNFQITLSETLGVEERGVYYESSGALRDMIQNHVMQLLGIIAMPAMKKFNSESIHEAKSQVFSALKPYSDKEVDENFVRGQYGEDEYGKQDAYRDSDNVASDSQTETYAAGKIVLDNPDWQGVPIYVRTGKRLKEKQSRIDIVFKNHNNSLFKNIKNNVLSILIEPDASYQIQLNGTALKMETEISSMEVDYSYMSEETKNLNGYESLLSSVLEGDHSYFTEWDELAATWKYIDAIRNRWDNTTADFPNYKSCSMGPDAADKLLEKDGNSWYWKG